MTDLIVTMKIMPSGPDADLGKIEEEAKKEISEFGGEVGKVEVEPIAFGLKALNLIFVMDEALGSTEALEEKVKKIKEVNSAEVVDARRAIG
ncbi:MAG: elongation factor 1-beta [Candidatus Woesearchaeota archaeon]|jgi:elongation factor 1-beta|nr:elongation factor 1-beta [Candidatus Woesearchaeota archaeon]MDP7505872.1 elongation factor 1-beta [Candidatus Woesearchaeota archaeon]MDP7610337.1 elongation factor 1-beta [Candidatus Woesearchaeota archaeon]|tara:strand:- start:136 stop:411 length:276 start_codon:yes stop_codon:yes gene_type:complete